MRQRNLTTTFKHGATGSEITYDKARIDEMAISGHYSTIFVHASCGRWNSGVWEPYPNSQFQHEITGSDYDDVMAKTTFNAMQDEVYSKLETAGKIGAGTEEDWES